MALLHRTSDRYVQQTAFFFDLSRFNRKLRGEELFFKSDDEDDGELQSLGRMHGHERNPFGGVREVLVLVGLQTDFREEIRNRRIVDSFVGALVHELMDSV